MFDRKEYYQRPDVKQKKREYKQRPYVKKQIKESLALCQAKRLITHGNILIMTNPFPPEINVDYHHLLNDFYNPDSNLWFMIPMPAITHKYVGGTSSDYGHWKYNAIWIEKLYNINIKELLNGEQQNLSSEK